VNGMIGTAELLAGSELDNKQRGYAATIQRCAESLLCVIDQILAAAESDAGRVK